MKYVIDISQKQAEKIENFIKKGLYNSFAQFISTSLENQIYIEESDSYKLTTNSETQKTENYPLRTNKIFDNYKLDGIRNSPKTTSIPSFSQLCISLQKIEEEKIWLWGQINRILPIKIGLRVLYVLLGNEQWIYLEKYKEQAANIAVEFGNTIRNYENSRGKLRDEKISAGLPEGNDKSKTRYQAHFLAYMRGDGKLDGAMCFLRFVNLDNNDKRRVKIGITEPGLNFARLENPVIDNNNFEQSLSEKEVNFYLEHIIKYVKSESSAMKWLLNELVNGTTQREAINIDLRKELGNIWNVTDPVINTQRAGLMARMFELGLIEKGKMGVKVNYKINNKGRIFLEKLNRR